MLTGIKSGSSPRLWGTHKSGKCGNLNQRFIPTPVGNTLDARTREIRRTVHPHACGEHMDKALKTPDNAGSSPRLWGTRGSERQPANRRRFIPTPVGNTLSGKASGPSLAVHPHACGEHSLGGVAASSSGGSSPRLWGTQTARQAGRINGRFIPTPVGNTP